MSNSKTTVPSPKKKAKAVAKSPALKPDLATRSMKALIEALAKLEGMLGKVTIVVTRFISKTRQFFFIEAGEAMLITGVRGPQGDDVDTDSDVYRERLGLNPSYIAIDLIGCMPVVSAMLARFSVSSIRNGMSIKTNLISWAEKGATVYFESDKANGSFRARQLGEDSLRLHISTSTLAAKVMPDSDIILLSLNKAAMLETFVHALDMMGGK